jgi:hypothetical protein
MMVWAVSLLNTELSPHVLTTVIGPLLHICHQIWKFIFVTISRRDDEVVLEKSVEEE